ncbi:C6 finger domain protein [Aspergillus ellipticus CBS 707.79]|uniref:C6 finger domain protein n=1 Tax=Aspergillus ellipticus CBS 707.79 TaxID=1448320 RepID=A0A319EMW8_9EURO|nr:C6 finger domain protein [Aspergillus ellipticus CBS 707.79]
MPGVPSNKACERCKKKHLKCDETRPSCQRCTQAGAECPGYVQTRKFIDQGASVRRRYAPYQESPSRQDTPISPSRATRESPLVWDRNAGNETTNKSQSPAQVTAPSLSDQPIDPSQSFSRSPIQNSGQANETQSHVQPGADGGVLNQPATIPTPGSIPGLNEPWSILNRGDIQGPLRFNITFTDASHSDATTPAHYQDLHTPGSPSQGTDKEDFQEVVSELATDTEHEISFLIRHFTDTMAPWLDLSDSRRFFAAYVPIRAIDTMFLRYSIAALAAKHLGQMKGATCTANIGIFTSPATMETYPNASNADWFLKSVNYYYLAVSRMNSSISESYTPSSSAVLESPVDIVNNWLRQQTVNSPRSPSDNLFWKKAENLLAAAVILTTHKLISEPCDKWQSYLTGVKPLFNSLLKLHSPSPEHPTKFSHGITTAFWNFARQDFIASYFTRFSTHFEPDNLPLWNAAGIPSDEQGNVIPNNHHAITSPEDFASNSLIWLLNKVTNFLADSKRSHLEQIGQSPTSAPTSPPSQPPTTSTWLKLSFEFQSWVDRMPETLRPCLRLNNPRDMSKLPEVSYVPFPEVYYGLPSCASTIQQYHFGRLALSLNRPPDAFAGPSTAYCRLQAYRELTKEVDFRCREIVGVSLARPQGCARVYMAPFLFGAGQCLEKPAERQIVLDLLSGVEADMGWETASQIQKLRELWDQR